MKRIVIKIGSNIITSAKGGVSHKRIYSIVKEVSELHSRNYEIIIVSSGAVSLGMKKLELKERPVNIQLRQAAAAVGQASLIRVYESGFEKYHLKVAQVLLTRGDFSKRDNYINTKNTLLTLLKYGIIPIINENDTVSTEEIKFGDNDQLASLVAVLVNAERLIILSDVKGLYSLNPKKNKKAKVLDYVYEITQEIERLAGGAGSVVGTGGMYSKLLATKKAMSFGIKVNIISGKKQGIMSNILLHNIHCGTEFIPIERKFSSRKGWILYAMKPKGIITLDIGALNAIKNKGKSLLPSGIVDVKGDFLKGDAVNCLDIEGKKFAKGIVNYPSKDIVRIKGKKSSEIESVLGYKYSDEVIHRDNFVILMQ